MAIQIALNKILLFINKIYLYINSRQKNKGFFPLWFKIFNVKSHVIIYAEKKIQSQKKA